MPIRSPESKARVFADKLLPGSFYVRDWHVALSCYTQYWICWVQKWVVFLKMSTVTYSLWEQIANFEYTLNAHIEYLLSIESTFWVGLCTLGEWLHILKLSKKLLYFGPMDWVPFLLTLSISFVLSVDIVGVSQRPEGNVTFCGIPSMPGRKQYAGEYKRVTWHGETAWSAVPTSDLSLIHIWRCRRIERCRSRWSPYH